MTDFVKRYTWIIPVVGFSILILAGILFS